MVKSRGAWKRAIVTSLISLLPLAACGDEVAKPFKAGEEALLRGDWNGATVHFSEAIGVDPNNANAYRGRGYVYFMKNKPAMAIADLSKAIQLNPAEAKAYRNRGDVYFVGIGDGERAIADYSEAIRRGLKDSGVFNSRGTAYLAKGDLKMATVDFSEAIRLDPREPHFYENRARARYQLQKDDLAMADIEEAIHIAPTAPSALQLRGAIYARKGDLGKALMDFDMAICLDAKAADAYRQRADIRFRTGDSAGAAMDYTEAVHLVLFNPLDTQPGWRNPSARQHEYENAIADCNNALRLEPNVPFLYEARGTLRIELGDYSRGVQDIQVAIKLDPHDSATSFEPWPEARLAPVAIQHGEEQVRRMLNDRPTMAKHGEKADVLYQWAARKFAGEDLRHTVFWDASEPPPFRTSEGWPTTNGGWSIRFARKCNDGAEKGTERPFEDLWYSAVFELYNAVNTEKFTQIQKQASEGRLRKREYVTRIVECESRTAEKTRAFYVHVFMPWARQNSVPSHPRSWNLGCRSSLLVGHVPETGAYWRAYERQFDMITLHALVGRGENEKALDLAKEMRKQAETSEEVAAICKCSGYCLLRLSRPLPAIDVFTEFIRIAPADADVYLWRATGYAMLREMDRALADYSEVIRLQPSNPEAYQLRGGAFRALGDEDRAHADFDRAKQLLRPERAHAPSPGQVQGHNTNYDETGR